jgi:deoxycytidine triphosphate deaminase
VILSDRKIRAALDRGSIRITPDPRADAGLWSSTAVDLRLGEAMLVMFRRHGSRGWEDSLL